MKIYILAIIFILSLNTNIFAEVISYIPKENIKMVLPTDTDLIAYKIAEFNGEEQEVIDFSYEQLDKFIYNVNNKIPYGINIIYYLKQGDKLSVKDWAYLYFDGEKATAYWYLENDKGEYYFARAIEIYGDVQRTVLQNSEFINIFKKIYLSSDTVGYRFYEGDAYSTPRLMVFPLKDEDKPLEEYKRYETYRYNIEIPKAWTFEDEKNYNNKATTITDKNDVHKIDMYIAQSKEMIIDDKSTDGYIYNIIEFYDDNINILNCDFYNKKDENKYYIYNGKSWFEIEDVDSILINLFKGGMILWIYQN